MLASRNLATAPKGKALRLVQSPFGGEQLVRLRCLAPAHASWLAAPHPPPGKVTVLVQAEHVLQRRHGLALLGAVLLLLFAPLLAASPLFFYVVGLLLSASALALCLLFALARAMPGAGLRCAQRAFGISAALAAALLEPLRERLLSAYVRASLWPLRQLARAWLPAEGEGVHVTVILLSTALFLLAAALGFFLVRKFVLDGAALHTEVLPGPRLFALCACRGCAFLLSLHGSCDAPLSASISVAGVAVACGVGRAMLARASAACTLLASASRRAAVHLGSLIAAESARRKAAAPPSPGPAEPAVPAPAVDRRRAGSGTSGDSTGPRLFRRPSGGGRLSEADERAVSASLDAQPEEPPQPCEGLPGARMEFLMRLRRGEAAARRARGDDGGALGGVEGLVRSPQFAAWAAANAGRIRVERDSRGAVEEDSEGEE
jgi:hypothetical protein